MCNELLQRPLGVIAAHAVRAAVTLHPPAWHFHMDALLTCTLFVSRWKLICHQLDLLVTAPCSAGGATGCRVLWRPQVKQLLFWAHLILQGMEQFPHPLCLLGSSHRVVLLGASCRDWVTDTSIESCLCLKISIFAQFHGFIKTIDIGLSKEKSWVEDLSCCLSVSDRLRRDAPVTSKN